MDSDSFPQKGLKLWWYVDQLYQIQKHKTFKYRRSRFEYSINLEYNLIHLLFSTKKFIKGIIHRAAVMRVYLEDISISQTYEAAYQISFKYVNKQVKYDILDIIH